MLQGNGGTASKQALSILEQCAIHSVKHANDPFVVLMFAIHL
jgi:hypothetical protein